MYPRRQTRKKVLVCPIRVNLFKHPYEALRVSVTRSLGRIVNSDLVIYCLIYCVICYLDIDTHSFQTCD
jgi:hypothetical protein